MADQLYDLKVIDSIHRLIAAQYELNDLYQADLISKDTYNVSQWAILAALIEFGGDGEMFLAP